jgi:hypothetical protein
MTDERRMIEVGASLANASNISLPISFCLKHSTAMIRAHNPIASVTHFRHRGTRHPLHNTLKIYTLMLTYPKLDKFTNGIR